MENIVIEAATPYIISWNDSYVQYKIMKKLPRFEAPTLKFEVPTLYLNCIFRILELIHKNKGSVNKIEKFLKLLNPWDIDIQNICKLLVPRRVKEDLKQCRINLRDIFIINDLEKFQMPYEIYRNLKYIVEDRFKGNMLRLWGNGIEITVTNGGDILNITFPFCNICCNFLKKFFNHSIRVRNGCCCCNIIFSCETCYDYFRIIISTPVKVIC